MPIFHKLDTVDEFKKRPIRRSLLGLIDYIYLAEKGSLMGKFSIIEGMRS